ncbi:DoxX family membrane protein, partial [Streptomyces celluloflavus]
MRGIPERLRAAPESVAAGRARPLVSAGDCGLLLLRLTFGLLMAGHGAQKLFGILGGQGLTATGREFTALGYRPGTVLGPPGGGGGFLGGRGVGRGGGGFKKRSWRRGFLW